MEVVRFVILLVFKVKVLELIKIQLSTDSSNIQLK